MPQQEATSSMLGTFLLFRMLYIHTFTAKDQEYDHPHYDDMVVETIRSQHKGKRGLTEKQILKHIMKTYDVDKARAPAEVKHSIKRLTKSGTIVHYQFKYKMPTHPDRKE